ncbi:hypothetical protein K4F52_007040 [Lecanicillium sp. MT-2017a]|nr:hypothetical protein K4F52_007040 [Lecanicillium sp. MT-2017a]
MSAPARLVTRVCRHCSRAPVSRRHFASSAAPINEEQWPQAFPRGEYYDSLLRDPIPYRSEKPEQAPSSADPNNILSDLNPTQERTLGALSSRIAPSDSSTPEAKARVIFGSRLLGPTEKAQRLATRQAQSTYTAGVLIPPRPEEPDNCCMSGCVNCVWDLFREEMEEWSSKTKEAKKRLAESSGSMDADGGGSESNWTPSIGESKIAPDMWDEDVFQSVPVGIREFMKQEKRLKERHAREGTDGG